MSVQTHFYEREDSLTRYESVSWHDDEDGFLIDAAVSPKFSMILTEMDSSHFVFSPRFTYDVVSIGELRKAKSKSLSKQQDDPIRAELCATDEEEEDSTQYEYKLSPSHSSASLLSPSRKPSVEDKRTYEDRPLYLSPDTCSTIPPSPTLTPCNSDSSPANNSDLLVVPPTSTKKQRINPTPKKLFAGQRTKNLIMGMGGTLGAQHHLRTGMKLFDAYATAFHVSRHAFLNGLAYSEGELSPEWLRGRTDEEWNLLEEYGIAFRD